MSIQSQSSSTDETLLHRDCPICPPDRVEEPHLLRRVKHWALVQCGSCGFVFLQNPPLPAVVAESFGWVNSLKEEKRRRRTDEPVVYRLSRLGRLPKKILHRDKLRRLMLKFVSEGRVLDLGCGRGQRVESLPDSVVPVGIELEPGPAAAADAAFREKGGYCICAPSSEGLTKLAEANFDGAILYAYLEHEPEPHVVLEALASVLRPGACVIIKVPNYGSINRVLRGTRWCGFRFPDHVNYFSPATLGRLANACGFEVARCGFSDGWFLSDNMWMVLRKPSA